MHGESKATLALYAVGSWIASLWAGMPQASNLLLLLIAVDLSMGFIAALIEGVFSARRALHGVATKAGYLVAIGVAHKAGQELGIHGDIGSMFAFFLCFTDLRSIFKNLHRIGVPLPPGLMDLLVTKSKARVEEPKN